MARMRALVCEAARGADSCLEIAAGTGLVTLDLAAEVQHLIATDYSQTMIEIVGERVRARGLTNVECEQADLYSLRHPSRSFDIVVAANVLHLVLDLEAALAAMRRVLRPGGKLIVPTFCHGETLLSRVVSKGLALTAFPAERRFTASGLCAAMDQAGMTVCCYELLPGIIPIAFIEAEIAQKFRTLTVVSSS